MHTHITLRTLEPELTNSIFWIFSQSDLMSCTSDLANESARSDHVRIRSSHVSARYGHELSAI